MRSNCLAVCYVVKPFRTTTSDAETTSDGQLNDNEWLLYRLVPSHVVLPSLGTLVVFGLVRPTRWLRSKVTRGNNEWLLRKPILRSSVIVVMALWNTADRHLLQATVGSPDQIESSLCQSMNMSHPAVRGVGQIRIEALPRKRPGVPFIRLWERLSVPILHRVIKCDGQLSQSGSGQARLEYFGHVVSSEGVSADKSKIDSMLSWPQPTTVKGLRGFLGKQTNLGYPRLTKFFPSIDQKPPQKLPPIILKTPPFEGMINKAPLEEKQKVLKEFLDLRRSKMDEMMLQGPGEDEMRIMNALKNMLHLFKSLGMPRLRIPLSSDGIDLYTRLGTGLLGLVNKRSKQVLIEAITFYKGEFTRIMVLVCLGYGCTVWYTVSPGVYGMPLPTELFPPDATYVDFFRDHFCHPLFKRLTFLESKYIIGDLLTAFENFYPFTQIEVPLLEVSDASSTASSSTSQIGSSSASTSQLTNPDIGSTSEVSGSASPAHRLSENQRSTIKLGLMMSIFLASGVLMEYSTQIDKSIGFLLENIENIYNDLIESGSPVISEKEFQSQQQLVLSGFYKLSPFQIRFLNAKGMSDFLNRGESHLFGVANDPYGDEESKSYMISSTAIKDELVLRGLARMIHQFTYYYSVEYETWVENLIIDYLKKIQLIGKSHRLYRLRIRPPLLGSAISRSRILEIVKLYIDDDSISFRLVKDFLYNRYQNEEGERCILNYIPDLGEITDAFEDLIMTSIFENAFLREFPGLCYYRFQNEVLINCTCEEDEITFNESVGYALLKEIKLPGDIVSIGPGDSPLPLYNDIYHLKIDRDKDVIAYRSR
ncbi:hypothetical protein Tco_0465044 [Tanacetum coccineum]